jgi:hypothetical protein
MSYFVIKRQHAIPSFLFRAIASWVVSLVALTTIAIALWLLYPTRDAQSVKAMPLPLLLILCLWGAYAAFGGITLYCLMWVYWIAVERSSVAGRIAWFLVLLLGLHYGALLYALVVWKKDMERMDGPQPLREPVFT